MTLARARASTEGSLALEGALSLFPLAIAVALNLELGLRARRHAVLAWATCAMVRERALGEAEDSANERARDRLLRAQGSAEGSWEESRTEEGLSLRGHVRYSALWSQIDPPKHHYEVNELCRFPF